MIIKLKNNTEIKIDKEDFIKIKDKNLLIKNNKYVYFNKNGVSIYLHRFLMRCRKNKVIDHIDGNPLNNKKSNLRICNQGENMRNQKKTNKKKSSKFKGVTYRKDRKAWISSIKLNYESIYLGYYKTETEAALAYNQAAIKYYGKFACLNEV